MSELRAKVKRLIREKRIAKAEARSYLDALNYQHQESRLLRNEAQRWKAIAGEAMGVLSKHWQLHEGGQQYSDLCRAYADALKAENSFDSIPDTAENWENGRLGRDERYVEVSDDPKS